MAPSNFSHGSHREVFTRVLRPGLSLGLGLLALMLVVIASSPTSYSAQAEPLPGGTPKLVLSSKIVTPTITTAGPVTLTYRISLINSGAWTATAVSLVDVLPTFTTYISGSAQAWPGPLPQVQNGTLTWNGDIGFDRAVEITFSALLSSSFTSGQIANSAVVSQASLHAPLTLTAVTTVTDVPLLTIAKTSLPGLPGPDKPIIYTLAVANHGQSVVALPITVTDRVPLSTTLLAVGPDGVTDGTLITWTRAVSLALGETTAFTFSVRAGHVPSGTVISNPTYLVSNPLSGVAAGKPCTVTIIDPILALSKSIWPDPPGSNREMTYTLTLLNSGSQATSVIITDRVPAGVAYVRGGVLASNIVSWSVPDLDTGEAAAFTYTVYISDVMQVPIVNADYQACSTEGVCQIGRPLTVTVAGPTFSAKVMLDPLAKKPGGGGGPVTPTLVVRNLGPGNAINARMTLYFENISVSANDLYVTPAVGTPPPFPSGSICGGISNCTSYVWIGSLAEGSTITFTTVTGQSTIGGSEGSPYTATIVITDALGGAATLPVTATTGGLVTHFSNLLPTKSAPPVIGRGQLLTYTLSVLNSALTTDLPSVLTDTLPLSTSLISVSNGGLTQTISGTLPRTVISWTLPALGPGEVVFRSFTVRVDNNLVSGTQIVNDNYQVQWYEVNASAYYSKTGLPVTTTVQEVGLIDSYKDVTPTLALPGTGKVLTYALHIVNSSAISLTGVTLSDVLPWRMSTYQRNAVASAGTIVSDIVTLHWTGDVGALSSEVVTFTVLVDPDYHGPVSNTATISHTDLLTPVVVYAVAYITDQPVLTIGKTAAPDPVKAGGELVYTIQLNNPGWQASGLIITDALPTNASYVPGSATANGQLVGNQMRWEFPVLKPGEGATFEFRVKVGSGKDVINQHYAVTSAEGVSATGLSVVTRISELRVYLPLIRKN